MEPTSPDRLCEDNRYKNICQRIRASLLYATATTSEGGGRDHDFDDDSSMGSSIASARPKILLRCGHASYSRAKGCWQIRHRSMAPSMASVSGGVLGTAASFVGRTSGGGVRRSVAAATPATWAAGLSQRNNTGEREVPPVEVVQAILRVAEFRAMMQQAQVQVRQNPPSVVGCPVGCRLRLENTRRSVVDLEPMLTTIFETYFPDTRRDYTDISCDILERARKGAVSLGIPNDEYSDEWVVDYGISSSEDLDDDEQEFGRAQQFPTAAIEAIQLFTRSCLRDSKPAAKRSRNSQSPTQDLAQRKRQRVASEATNLSGSTSNMHRHVSNENDVDHSSELPLLNSDHGEPTRSEARGKYKTSNGRNGVKLARHDADEYFDDPQIANANQQQQDDNEHKTGRVRKRSLSLEPTVESIRDTPMENDALMSPLRHHEGYHCAYEADNDREDEPKGLVEGRMPPPHAKINSVGRSESSTGRNDGSGVALHQPSGQHSSPNHLDDSESDRKDHESAPANQAELDDGTENSNHDMDDGSNLAGDSVEEHAEHGEIEPHQPEEQALVHNLAEGLEDRGARGDAADAQRASKITEGSTDETESDDMSADAWSTNASTPLPWSPMRSPTTPIESPALRRSARKRFVWVNEDATESDTLKDRKLPARGSKSPNEHRAPSVDREPEAVERSAEGLPHFPVVPDSPNADSSPGKGVRRRNPSRKATLRQRPPTDPTADELKEASSVPDAVDVNGSREQGATRAGDSAAVSKSRKRKAPTSLPTNSDLKGGQESSKEKDDEGIADSKKPRRKVATDTKDGVTTDDSVKRDRGKKKHTIWTEDVSESSVNQSHGLPWIHLTHLGLVSDYHGLQRQFDSAFWPLTFNPSVAIMREAIESRLKTIEFDGFGESDEAADYEKAVQSYPARAEEEKIAHQQRLARFIQMRDADEAREANNGPIKRNKVEAGIERLIARPLLFAWKFNGNAEIPGACRAGISCEICHSRTLISAEGKIALPSCKKIDLEELYNSQETDGQQQKRRSRIAQLTSQKELSVMLLSELRHTFAFIEKFNRGINGEFVQGEKELLEQETVDEEDSEQGDSDMLPSSLESHARHKREIQTSGSQLTLKTTHASNKVGTTPAPSSRDSKRRPPTTVGSKRRAMDSKHALGASKDETSRTTGEEMASSQFGRVLVKIKKNGSGHGKHVLDVDVHHDIPNFARKLATPARFKFKELSHVGHLSDYQGVQRRHEGYFALPANGSIPTTIEAIDGFLKTVDFDDVDDDDVEPTADRLGYQRIIRGYQAMADQEKIEKLKHEEDRNLRVRQFEFEHRNSKRSQGEVEYDQFAQRPLRFSAQSKPNDSEGSKCKFGQNCIVCSLKHILADEKDADRVINPPFRKIDVATIESPKDQNEKSKDENDTKKAGRLNRTAALKSQRQDAARILQEMSHTLKFIETFNRGLIGRDKPALKKKN